MSDDSLPLGRPLQLHLHASRHLAAIFVLLHVGAIACVLTLRLPVGLQGVLVGLLAAGVWPALTRHALRLSPGAVVAVRFFPGAGWTLIDRAQRSMRARLVGEAFIHPALTVLRFRCGSGARLSVVIPFDATDDRAARVLRARLRSARGHWD